MSAFTEYTYYKQLGSAGFRDDLLAQSSDEVETRVSRSDDILLQVLILYTSYTFSDVDDLYVVR